MIILIAGTVGAGLDFAGAARKTRIFSAALAFAGTLLVALTARGHYMLGHALALFDIGAVLTLLIGLCLDLGEASNRVSKACLIGRGGVQGIA